MNQEENKSFLIVSIISSLCIVFIFEAIIFGLQETRRSADEIATINQSRIRPQTRDGLSDAEKIQSCLDGGGLPNYYSGNFTDCRTN